MLNSTTPEYIKVTQAFLRFYVLATQYLDHRLGTVIGESLSQDEVSAHLTQSRDALLQLVSVNHIVLGKVEKEYEGIFRLDVASSALTDLRLVLCNKTNVLSDLLAVLRLIPQKS